MIYRRICIEEYIGKWEKKITGFDLQLILTWHMQDNDPNLIGYIGRIQIKMLETSNWRVSVCLNVYDPIIYVLCGYELNF